MNHCYCIRLTISITVMSSSEVDDDEEDIVVVVGGDDDGNGRFFILFISWITILPLNVLHILYFTSSEIHHSLRQHFHSPF